MLRISFCPNGLVLNVNIHIAKTAASKNTQNPMLRQGNVSGFHCITNWLLEELYFKLVSLHFETKRILIKCRTSNKIQITVKLIYATKCYKWAKIKFAAPIFFSLPVHHLNKVHSTLCLNIFLCKPISSYIPLLPSAQTQKTTQYNSTV